MKINTKLFSTVLIVLVVSGAVVISITGIVSRGMIKKEVMKMMEKMYGPDGEMPLDQKGKEPLAVRIGAGIINKLKRFKKR